MVQGLVDERMSQDSYLSGSGKVRQVSLDAGKILVLTKVSREVFIESNTLRLSLEFLLILTASFSPISLMLVCISLRPTAP